MTVLDASAVLGCLNREPGYEQVLDHMDGGSISTVNWSEVCQKVEAYTGNLDLAQGLVALGLQVRPFQRNDAEIAAALDRHLHADLSLADRACLGLGLAFNQSVVTANHSWQGILSDLPVQIIQVGGVNYSGLPA